MQSTAIRRSLFAALLAAAGCLAFSCDLVEARGDDTAAAPALSGPPTVKGRSRPRRGPDSF